MKKLITLFAAAMLASPAFADEGMWLLPLLEKINKNAIYSLGGRLSPDEIYSINHSSIKDAVVLFGSGCTGELISGNGLLVTNHHCGYGSIQSISSPDHNYLEDGFWAMDKSEEIPIKGMTVTFLQSMTDVSAKVNSAIDKGKNSSVVAEIESKAGKDNPGCKAKVVSFFNSNVHYLIISKTYRDVRFVGAPPAATGKFGGDTDNWMWPRHTCDFSMFRVYAGKDNEPADYSEDNIPMTPRQSLKISLKGVNEGDFAMIMGYPGRTQRFQSVAQLENMLRLNDVRIDARTIRQRVMWDERMADPVVNLQYASKYARSSNGWKKWIGMREAFAKLGILDRQRKREADFRAWAAQKPSKRSSYVQSLDCIAQNAEESAAIDRERTLFGETIETIELLRMTKASDAAYKDYNADVDRKMAMSMVQHYLDRAATEFRMAISLQEIEDMFEHSVYTSKEKRDSAKASGHDMKNDPAKVLYDRVRSFGAEKFAKKDNSSLDAALRNYNAGLLEWRKGEALYPDANLTCRLTYGQVKGYSPKDAVQFLHYTTLRGVMQKEDPGNYEFRVPARLKEIYETKDYGQYANADGELVTCFLTNLDITGGNSGSPVLDADGNLIGLAFDGNWEAMSSDVMFEPDLQRCICVDIRYVLLMMDKFGGAGYLLNEMDIVK